MNHYPHHIGDFNGATRHLSRLERSIYSDLIDVYYDTEQPLSLDVKVLSRKIIASTAKEVQALKDVLSEFFIKGADGYHNVRCDKEIAAYQSKSKKAKASAEARWSKPETEDYAQESQCSDDANAYETHDERNANQNQNQNHTNNNTREAFEKLDSQGEYVAKPVRELFNMTLDWKPNQQTFSAIAMRNGLPAEYSDDRLAGFVSYWQAEAIELTQGQWENKFATYLKRPVLVPKESKPKSFAKNQQPQYDEYVMPPPYVPPPKSTAKKATPEEIKIIMDEMRRKMAGGE